MIKHLSKAAHRVLFICMVEFTIAFNQKGPGVNRAPKKHYSNVLLGKLSDQIFRSVPGNLGIGKFLSAFDHDVVILLFVGKIVL